MSMEPYKTAYKTYDRGVNVTGLCSVRRIPLAGGRECSRHGNRGREAEDEEEKVCDLCLDHEKKFEKKSL